MGNLGTFDPGGKCAGYGIFIGDQLVEVGLSRTKEKHTFARAQAHRAFVHARMQHWGITRVRAEAMVFRQRENKGDPQILVDLNLITGFVGTEWIEPHNWKGMVPKEVHQPKILAALRAEELALVDAVMPPSLRHNAIDAVGIGLNALGRLPVASWQPTTAPKVPAKWPTKRCSKRSKLRTQLVASASSSTKTGGRRSAMKRAVGSRSRPKPPSFSIAPFKMPTSSAPV